MISKPVKIYCRLLLILNLLILTTSGLPGQAISYAEIFGSDWTKALRFVKENQEWMQKTCKLCRVDYPLAVSIVFPELIRYSALRDKMEFTLLKALYTHKGSEYADFSVGVFQMKPSFAEAILEEVFKTRDRKFSRYFNRIHRSLTEREKRTVILKELEDPEAQIIYLLVMIRLLDKKFENQQWNDMAEKVRFYAAAYNSGFNSPEVRIRQQMEAVSFHTGLVRPSTCYCYSDISAAFYKNIFMNSSTY